MAPITGKIFIRKFIRNVEDHGFSHAFKKTFQFILSPFFESRVYRIYAIDFDSSKLSSASKQSGFEFKILHKKDYDLIADIEDMEEWLAGRLGSKIASNSLCLTALDGRHVAGFNLVSFGKVFLPLLNTTRQLQADEAWSDQITVHKNYRRMGIASQLRFHMFQELKKRGVRRFFGGTLRSNEPSLRLARKVGFKELEDVRYVKFLFMKKWRTTQIGVLPEASADNLNTDIAG